MTRIPLGHTIPIHGAGAIAADTAFPTAAARELRNDQMRANLRHATHTIRAKRAHVVEELPDWEELRLAASALKQSVMARLPELLQEFEAAFTARGGTVHWARDAAEANRIVHSLVRERGVTEVLKVKSMATQEIRLNEYLEERGITPVETDLAELIVQLDHDQPSHILVPAIHKNRREVCDIFRREMPDAPADLDDEPAHLAAAARSHLRRRFLRSTVAISGANVGVAATGTLGVVESEGNGRMCLTLPDTLITVMGIEKLVPTVADLEVFLQLLPRSSTGERMNPYTSLWTGVTPGDGPQDVHVVLLDNGRSAALADPVGRPALHCIRCSACMNVCPVYERTGGHAYGSVYPGPIGAILTPQLGGLQTAENASLPYASTLCGACFDACPVRIDIPSILVHLRGRAIADRGGRRRTDQFGLAMAGARWTLSSGRRFSFAHHALPVGRLLAGRDRRFRRLPGLAGRWTRSRDLPAPPLQSFREWFAVRGGTKAPTGASEQRTPGDGKQGGSR